MSRSGQNSRVLGSAPDVNEDTHDTSDAMASEQPTDGVTTDVDHSAPQAKAEPKGTVGYFVRQRGLSTAVGSAAPSGAKPPQSAPFPRSGSRSGSTVGQIFAAELGGESADPTPPPPEGPLAPIISVHKLGERYDELDHFSALLPQVLDASIEPPTYLVIGKASAGKSALLERLTLLPIFPQGTRAVILVRMRRSAVAGTPCTLGVIETRELFDSPRTDGLAPVLAADSLGVLSEDGSEILSPGAADESQADGGGGSGGGGKGRVEGRVAALMDQLMSSVRAVPPAGLPPANHPPSAGRAMRDVCTDKVIVITLSHPRLPSLDIIDLPGLVGADHSSKAIRELTTRFLDRFREREHAYFLAVVPNGETPSGDLGVNLLFESEVQPERIIGVFTKADRAIGDDPMRVPADFATQRSYPFKDDAGIPPGYGWVATMLNPLLSNVAASPAEPARLTLAAGAEIGWFGRMMKLTCDPLGAFPAPVPPAAAYGCNALVGILNASYAVFLRKVWAPRMLLKLRGEWRRKRDGGATLVALRQADVGRAIEVRGDTLMVNGRVRQVRWTGAHHFDLEGSIVSVDEAVKGDVGVARGRRTRYLAEGAGERQVVFIGNPVAKVDLALHSFGEANAEGEGVGEGEAVALAMDSIGLRDLGEPATREMVMGGGAEKARHLGQVATKVAVAAIQLAFSEPPERDGPSPRSQREAVTAYMLLEADPLAPDLHARVASLLSRQRRDPGPFDRRAVWQTLQSLVADKVGDAADQFAVAVREALDASEDDFKLARFPRFLDAIEAECRRFYLEPNRFAGHDLMTIVDEVAAALPPEAWVESTAAKRAELETDIAEARQAEEKLIALIHAGRPPPAPPKGAAGKRGSEWGDLLYSYASLSPADHDAREAAELADLQARGGAAFSPETVEAMVTSAGRLPPHFPLEDLAAAGFPASMMRRAGVKLERLAEAGYTVHALVLANFGVGEIVELGLGEDGVTFSPDQWDRAGLSCRQLKEQKCPLAYLQRSGFHVKDLLTAGFTPRDLRSKGLDARTLYTAGALTSQGTADRDFLPQSVATLAEAGFRATELKAAGFGARPLKGAGVGARELHEAGFGIRQLREARVSATKLRSFGYDLPTLADAETPLGELRDAGFSAVELHRFFSMRSLKEEGEFTAEELRAAAFSAEQCYPAFSAQQLRNANYTCRQVREAGCTVGELHEAGFELADLKQADTPINELVLAGYTPKQLDAAGYAFEALSRHFRIADLIDDGIEPRGKVGFKGSHAEDLWRAGYEPSKLLTSGFLEVHLRQIGFEDVHFKSSSTPKPLSARSRGISEDKIDFRARTISTVVKDARRVDLMFDVLQAVVKYAPRLLVLRLKHDLMESTGAATWLEYMAEQAYFLPKLKANKAEKGRQRALTKTQALAPTRADSKGHGTSGRVSFSEHVDDSREVDAADATAKAAPPSGAAADTAGKPATATVPPATALPAIAPPATVPPSPSGMAPTSPGSPAPAARPSSSFAANFAKRKAAGTAQPAVGAAIGKSVAEGAVIEGETPTPPPSSPPSPPPSPPPPPTPDTPVLLLPAFCARPPSPPPSPPSEEKQKRGLFGGAAHKAYKVATGKGKKKKGDDEDEGTDGERTPSTSKSDLLSDELKPETAPAADAQHEAEATKPPRTKRGSFMPHAMAPPKDVISAATLAASSSSAAFASNAEEEMEEAAAAIAAAEPAAAKKKWQPSFGGMGSRSKPESKPGGAAVPGANVGVAQEGSVEAGRHEKIGAAIGGSDFARALVLIDEGLAANPSDSVLKSYRGWVKGLAKQGKAEAGEAPAEDNGEVYKWRDATDVRGRATLAQLRAMVENDELDPLNCWLWNKNVTDEEGQSTWMPLLTVFEREEDPEFRGEADPQRASELMLSLLLFGSGRVLLERMAAAAMSSPICEALEIVVCAMKQRGGESGDGLQSLKDMLPLEGPLTSRARQSSASVLHAARKRRGFVKYREEVPAADGAISALVSQWVRELIDANPLVLGCEWAPVPEGAPPTKGVPLACPALAAALRKGTTTFTREELDSTLKPTLDAEGLRVSHYLQVDDRPLRFFKPLAARPKRDEARAPSDAKYRPRGWLELLIGSLIELSTEMPRVLRSFGALPSGWLQGEKLTSSVLTLQLTSGNRNSTRGALEDPFVRKTFDEDAWLLTIPAFWSEQTWALFDDATQKLYPKLHAAPNSFYYQLVVLIIRLMGGDEGSGVAKAVDSMLDSFENGMDDKKLAFLNRMLSDVTERCSSDPLAFTHFPLSDLDKVATAGLKTVASLGDDAKMDKAKTAMEELLKSYLKDFPPVQWAKLFTDAASKAYHLKYMFREDVTEATKQFKLAVKSCPTESGGGNGGMFDALVDKALRTYGKKGLVDQDALQRTNFMRNPRELMDLIDPANFAPGKDNRDPLLQQVADIAVKYMEMTVASSSGSKGESNGEDRGEGKDEGKGEATGGGGGIALLPHHTQIMVMLMLVHFYEERATWKKDFSALIMQMKTGEGKSIVIAMLSVLMCTRFNKRVHVLENNEGLLERDYATYKPFFERFQLTSNKRIDGDSHICYCLKSENNAFFNASLANGALDLSDTILIVDEVDDLVVNENPSIGYVKPDVEKTPDYERCYTALQVDDGLRPDELPASSLQAWLTSYAKLDAAAAASLAGKLTQDGIDSPSILSAAGVSAEELKSAYAADEATTSAVLLAIERAKVPVPLWKECARHKAEAAEKAEGVDFQQGDSKKLMLEKLPDGSVKTPKVTLTDGWLEFLNFRDHDVSPRKNTFFSWLCTPYMYTQYSCIFGLTGSIGGAAERAYIKNTYRAVPFEVPQFLQTCPGTGKEPPKNLGVQLLPTHRQKLHEVVRLTCEFFKGVPVLVITRGGAELEEVHTLLREALPGPMGVEPWSAKRTWNAIDEHLLVLRERNARGDLQKDKWASVIEQATRRRGTHETSFCCVTVTDLFGGRGHDYSVDDERAIANGGMLVIATSMPDEREWTQWKGRTARQDKPGQFHVVLSEDAEPFNEGKEGAEYLKEFKKLKSEKPAKGSTAEKSVNDLRIESLHRRKDRHMNATLDRFKSDQAKGAWLNELCEKYYASSAAPPSADGSADSASSPKHKGEHKGEPSAALLRARDERRPWPMVGSPHESTDQRLRDLLTDARSLENGKQIRDVAKQELGLDLGGPPAHWGWELSKLFVAPPSSTPAMAVIFLLDRSYDQFRKTAIAAVEKVFTKYLPEGCVVGYRGVGETKPSGEAKPIFEMTEKTPKTVPTMLKQIRESDVRSSAPPTLYRSMEDAIRELKKPVHTERSKWLICLTDLVDLEFKENSASRNKVDALASMMSTQGGEGTAAKASRAKKEAAAPLQKFNLAIVDTSEMKVSGKPIKYQPDHAMWPTWKANARRMVQQLTDRGTTSMGYSISADDFQQIDRAFEAVAKLMADTGTAAA